MNRPVLISNAMLERAALVCNTMRGISGHDPRRRGRLRPLVLSRQLACAQLLSEGWTEDQVGTVIGIDHATVNHHRARVRDFETLPGYDAERELLARLRTELNQQHADR